MPTPSELQVTGQELTDRRKSLGLSRAVMAGLADVGLTSLQNVELGAVAAAKSTVTAKVVEVLERLEAERDEGVPLREAKADA